MCSRCNLKTIASIALCPISQNECDIEEYFLVGSAGKREEETAEEVMFYSQNIAPLLERMTEASSSKS